MPIKVLVPRLGEGVDEVTVTKWLKQEGQPVTELEPLLEVNTDKVDTEIPSPASGTLLKIELGDNTPARVGQVLAWIGQPGEEIPSGDPAAPAPQTAPPKAEPASAGFDRPSPPAPAADRELGFLSPVVRRIAADQNVDLRQVRGSGLNGRITKQDVLDHLSGAPQPAAGSVLPLTPIRRQIAEHMVASQRTSPHVLTVMEADLSRVITHRAANKAAFARDGVNLTFTAYFMTAIVAGLKAYPLVNSSWTEQGILLRPEIHLGMATSLGEDGLIVPVIRDADRLSLLGMARAINDLAGRARARKLQPDEVRGGTFTLTNHGISGSLFALPIINQPQCGILGAGALQKRAVVVTDEHGNDAIAIRPMVYLSFVFDHRILDGASADWFLARVKETLESWA